jgi:hypothetical protein
MRLSQARTVLSHSRDVAMEILAGTKFLDKEYATAKKRTVQRDAVRAKKVPVLPDKCAVDALAKLRVGKQRSLAEAAKTSEKVAITAPSAHYPEDPKLSLRSSSLVASVAPIEELRTALVEFATRYNETWLVARHGYRTPAQVRADARRRRHDDGSSLRPARWLFSTILMRP